jgi:hypothetical protein
MGAKGGGVKRFRAWIEARPGFQAWTHLACVALLLASVICASLHEPAVALGAFLALGAVFNLACAVAAFHEAACGKPGRLQ